MYSRLEEINPDIFYQGDIIDNFPFFAVPDNFSILSSLSSKTFELTLERIEESSGEKIIALPVKFRKVLLLSQTCDIQQRQNVIISPVYSIAEALAVGVLTPGKAESLKGRKIKYWFFLPALPGQLEDSFVDLQTMHYVPKKIVELYKKNKSLSLNDWGRHHLGWCLSDFFGRPIEDKNI